MLKSNSAKLSLATILSLGLCLCTPAWAQDPPTTPNNGASNGNSSNNGPRTAPGTPGETAPTRAWNPTVGFELKTTTHKKGARGTRTEAHTLIEYVIPNESASWTPEQKQIIERWERLSLKEKTKFFFENYKGGHQATNFKTDARKAPFLDGSVSWYEHMNIPHIEVRSKPFESSAEAVKQMKALKSAIPETIAFHTHYRFPYKGDKVAPKAEAVTDWMRRVSWSIWLRRAATSSRSDFVLKAMDNTPVNAAELEKALKTFSNESTSPSKDIIERRGIRVNRMSSAQGPVLDIEFRGLMKDVNRIERYIELADKAFRTGEFGPFKYGENSAMRQHEGRNVLQFYTFGWHGKGTISEGELKYISEQVERFRTQSNINTRLSPDQVKEAVRHLATADSKAGKKMLMPVAWEWLFMPIEHDRALPEEVRQKYEKNRARYVQKLVKLAERVNSGEFGKANPAPGETSNYRAEAVASRTRRILHDFVNESYKAGTKTGHLADFYEASLFEPKTVEKHNQEFRRRTGREGFSNRREAPKNASEAKFNRGEVTNVFNTLRHAAVEATGMRSLALGESAESAKLAAENLSRVSTTGLEITSDKGLNIEYDRGRNKVVVSEGLLSEINRRSQSLPQGERTAFRNKALGLMVGHELGHASGIKAERAADISSVELLQRSPELYTNSKGEVKPLTEADIKRTVRTFSEAGTAFQNILYRLKNLPKYGTTRGREGVLSAAAAGQGDALAKFRRADGTLRWKPLLASKTLTHTGGLAHFGLALFLKELAVVVKTGDRLRIEEFFDGLLTTDFVQTYALFAAGAHYSNVAYSKYAAKYIKNRFVSGILRTNIVLATGMALPEIAAGHFDGRTFAINLAGIGFATTAMKAGLEGLKMVAKLGKVDRAGKVAATLQRYHKFAKVGGWFYTAAETAVILYYGDELAQYITHYLDDRAARNAVGDSTLKLAEASKGSDQDFEKALAEFSAAHIHYRDHLFKPLLDEEALYQSRMTKVSEDAMNLETKRQLMIERVKKYKHLERVVLAEHDSIEAYAQSLVERDEAKLSAKVDEIMSTYNRNREASLDAVYTKERRNGDYLKLKDLGWALRGAPAGAQDDPMKGRSDYFARRHRSSALSDLKKAARNISSNRLQAYEDELAVLRSMRAGIANGSKKAAALDEHIAFVERMFSKDTQLGTPTKSVSSDGAKGEMDKLGK